MPSGNSLAVSMIMNMGPSGIDEFVPGLYFWWAAWYSCALSSEGKNPRTATWGRALASGHRMLDTAATKYLKESPAGLGRNRCLSLSIFKRRICRG